MKALFALGFFLITSNALAENADLSCSDHTFAYTTMTTKNFNSDSRFMTITFESELQPHFKELALAPMDGWGQASVELVVNKAECTQQPGTALLSCEAKNPDLVVSFDENNEHRHVFRLRPSSAMLKTELDTTSKMPMLKTKLTVVLEHETKERNVELAFFADKEGKCD